MRYLFTVHASRFTLFLHLRRVGVPMLLLLVRHANAGARDPAQWPDDRDRPLTDKGRKVQARRQPLSPQARPGADPRAHQPVDPRGADRGDPGRGRAGGDSRRCPANRWPTTPISSGLQDYVGDQPPEAIVAMVGHSPWMEELASTPARRGLDQASDGFSEERRDGDRDRSPGAGGGGAEVLPAAQDGVVVNSFTLASSPSARRWPGWTSAPGSPSPWG